MSKSEAVFTVTPFRLKTILREEFLFPLLNLEPLFPELRIFRVWG